MKNLTENQLEFLYTFFASSIHTGEYPKWRKIAYNLLTKGKCIVARTSYIFEGGIGNFIEVEEAEDAVGCLLCEQPIG